MANNTITNIALLLQTTRLVRNGQSVLGKLQEQLATGNVTSDLSELGSTQSRRLLDLRASNTERDSYILTIDSIKPRVDAQLLSLDGMQDTVSDLRSMIGINNSYQSIQDVGGVARIQDMLRNAQYYLDQKIDDRYLFAGDRYSTVPVRDLLSLPVPPVEPYPYTPSTSPALPSYDTNAPGTSAAAYAQDTVFVDDGLNLNYGITSVEPGVQNYIMGLRWAYAASQDSVNFDTYMAQADQLLGTAQVQLRGLQSKATSSQATLIATRDLHQFAKNLIAADTDQIFAVDKNEVAAKITTLSAQIEASYAATSRIINLSIVNYI